MIHRQILIQMAHMFSTKPLIHQSEHGLHIKKKDRLAQKGQFGSFSANTD